MALYASVLACPRALNLRVLTSLLSSQHGISSSTATSILILPRLLLLPRAGRPRSWSSCTCKRALRLPLPTENGIETQTQRVQCMSTAVPRLHHAAASEERQSQVGQERAEETLALTFQQAIQQLQNYWASVGCAVVQSSSTEVGAGTMNPSTFLRVLGPEPWNVAYVEPSIRPDDSRYGENPNRVQRHTQFQVILKPDPGNAQELYLGSLAAIGIDTQAHDVRFVEDNWESPVLGAWGLGWEVWMDGMEITQFTYFQQAGSIALDPVSVEITYGLERILMSLQNVDHFSKIKYFSGITYGELFLENEREMSAFNLEFADVDVAKKRFDLYDAEANSLLAVGLAIPAYDHLLKASHIFNVLDARGAVGVTERARFFARMRLLARKCAQLWVATREKLNHPLGISGSLPCLEHPPEALREAALQIIAPSTFVLEIGSEELPAQDVSSGIAQLQVAMKPFFERKRLKHGQISVCGTPRRLAIIVEQLAHEQSACEREVRGPPVSKVYDAHGQPTKAMEGFCKKNGVAIDSVFARVDGKTEYIFAKVRDEGRHAVEVLSESLPELLTEITFSRTMRWNSQTLYGRPLRWLLALHGDAVVPFAYAGVVSSRFTRGLRNSIHSVMQVARAEDYLSALDDSGVVISLEERHKFIWSESSSLAVTVNGKISEEARFSLLDEVVNLVEAPLPLIGHFDESFLNLPAEVLKTVMHKHQRYLPVEEKASNHLLPFFVAVANGKVNEEVVRRGNEAVLRARYEDARFYYESDIAKPLAEHRTLLDGIVFQDKLGSMLDKTKRLESMIQPLGALMSLDKSTLSVALQAASLARADLATSMVMEFTSLAGIMGKHYAKKEGYPAEVADAIFESVLPRFAGDALPESVVGLLLSVADRLDSLVGLFTVGCQPSATADQFGLRRTAYGLVQSLVQIDKDLDLKQALTIASSVQPVIVTEKVQRDVLLFIIRRLEQLLVDDGANVELVRSVLAERGHVPALAARSVPQLTKIAENGCLSRILEAYARPRRIVRGILPSIPSQVNEDLFVLPEERLLWEAYTRTAAQLCGNVAVDVFVEASLGLVEPLENFFNKVFVMAEEQDLRTNRLSLLQQISMLPAGIIDLSQLPGF
ncbi:hypothetical protein O6H91_Y425700 [Diphasiastrum complanatum]|nr:hypothetical protein O6H91_Y425700 [Diphasiastrum complanatum]KAJ7248193.1 hypothetical protein O6H91_Y425700 [Diphasiastrum complanatum]KAJ7248196.1 hypothetical protein O6H91_Y425700 [Diphasiastrum complanatum]